MKGVIGIIIFLFCIGCSGKTLYRVEYCTGVIPEVYDKIKGTLLEREWLGLDTAFVSWEEYQVMLDEWKYSGHYIVVSDSCKGVRIIK